MSNIESSWAEYCSEEMTGSWTPELVMERMVEAFETLKRVPGGVGPKGFGSNWPAIVREFSDLVDQQTSDDARKRFWENASRPDKEEISRMEEALGWPARYLGDNPIAADALNLWAMCKAWHRSIDGVIRQRAKAAADLARVVEREINQRRGIVRQQSASEAATWANKRRFMSDGSAEAKERIVANAIIRLERDLARKGLLHAAIMVRPSEVSPDKVISRTGMDRHRYAGAKLIAEALG